MQILKASTEVKVVIGPFLDVGDGFTPETGLTLGGFDEAIVLKHESATEVDVSSNTWAEIDSTNVRGYYHLTLATTDVSAEGMLTVIMQDDTVFLPVWKDFQVVNEAVYESLYGGTPSIIYGTCEASGSVTEIRTNLDADTNYLLTTNDALIGRVLIFDGNTTAALKSQAGVITGYDGSTGYVTVASGEFTTAAASGDTFKIY